MSLHELSFEQPTQTKYGDAHYRVAELGSEGLIAVRVTQPDYETKEHLEETDGLQGLRKVPQKSLQD